MKRDDKYDRLCKSKGKNVKVSKCMQSYANFERGQQKINYFSLGPASRPGPSHGIDVYVCVQCMCVFLCACPSPPRRSLNL